MCWASAPLEEHRTLTYEPDNTHRRWSQHLLGIWLDKASEIRLSVSAIRSSETLKAFISILDGANVVSSFVMRTMIPLAQVVPLDNMTVAYTSFRM